MSIFDSGYRVQLQNGVWRVTLDGRFFGDYRSKLHALEGVAVARRALEASGRTVGVVVVPAEQA